MLVLNNKIVQATELELFEFWLDRWSSIMDFNEYKRKVQEKGTIIVEDEAMIQGGKSSG